MTGRAEQIAAAVEAVLDSTEWYCDDDHEWGGRERLTARLRAALAAQEGERGGAESVLAIVRRALDDELANLADDGARLSHSVVRRIEAILADPAGALAKHDAEVLRAAADDLPDLAWTDRESVTCTIRASLRERADRIEEGS